MSSLPFPLLMLLAIGAVVLLAYLSRRYPPIGILAGLAFLGAVVYVWRSVSSESFRSDGSPAGAIIVVLFLIFELMLAIFGLWFIIRALTSGRHEAALEREAESHENRLAAIRANAVDGDPLPALPNQSTADRATAAIPGSTTTPRPTPSIDLEPENDPRSLKSNVNGAAAILAIMVALVFAIPAVRLMLGISNQLLCGRRTCFDLFGLFIRMQAQGLGVLVGLCYLVISVPFFWVAYRALWPRARSPHKPRGWLEKYRDDPRAAARLAAAEAKTSRDKA